MFSQLQDEQGSALLEVALLSPLLALLIYGMLQTGLRVLERQRFEIGLDFAARAALSALTDSGADGAAGEAARALAWTLAGSLPSVATVDAAAGRLADKAALLRSRRALSVSICPGSSGWNLAAAWTPAPGRTPLQGRRHVPHLSGLPAPSGACGDSS
jgi:Flp pilus assembly protein TadG